ncbi:recombinase family protein [Nocardia sp. NPDC004278]
MLSSVDRIFVDKRFSGTTRRNRTGPDNAIIAVTAAAAAVTDRPVVLTATRFDRFARNTAEAGQILGGLRDREVLLGARPPGLRLGQPVRGPRNQLSRPGSRPGRAGSAHARYKRQRYREPEPGRTAFAADQLDLVLDKRPTVDQLVVVQLTHHRRANYTEKATATAICGR